MMKKLYIVLGLIIIGVGVAYYLYNKPTKNIEKSEIDASISASALLSAFENNEAEANVKYLNKVLEVKGLIKDITKENETHSILLRTENEISGVLCSMEKPLNEKDVEVGDSVIVKGLCSGMLIDVVLIKCSIVN